MPVTVPRPRGQDQPPRRPAGHQNTAAPTQPEFRLRGIVPDPRTAGQGPLLCPGRARSWTKGFGRLSVLLDSGVPDLAATGAAVVVVGPRGLHGVAAGGQCDVLSCALPR